MSKTIRVATLYLYGESTGYAVTSKKALGGICAELGEAFSSEEDRDYTIEFHDMDRAEFEALPEFEGF